MSTCYSHRKSLLSIRVCSNILSRSILDRLMLSIIGFAKLFTGCVVCNKVAYLHLCSKCRRFLFKTPKQIFLPTFFSTFPRYQTNNQKGCITSTFLSTFWNSLVIGVPSNESRKDENYSKSYYSVIRIRSPLLRFLRRLV
jgi:hypothetical protein